MLILLVLLSISSGITKLIQLPEEMEIFRTAGFADVLILIFGALQLVGGTLLIFSVTRVIGALIMTITFSVATWVLFQNGLKTFAFISISFIGLAVYQFVDKLSAKDLRNIKL